MGSIQHRATRIQTTPFLCKKGHRHVLDISWQTNYSKEGNLYYCYICDMWTGIRPGSIDSVWWIKRSPNETDSFRGMLQDARRYAEAASVHVEIEVCP